MPYDDASPNPVDLHVGARVRMRRKVLHLSQTELAEALGLTFQQVQKYERGTNRISASKLYEIALTLKAPVALFFEGYDDGGPSDGVTAVETAQALHGFLMTSDGLELAKAFPRIRSGKRRRQILELVKALAEENS